MSEDEKPPVTQYRIVGAAVATNLLKAEGAVQSNVAEPEDEFKSLYQASGSNHVILEPTYPLGVLHAKTQENNALSPCVEAMVTNIDGTGYDFKRKGEEKENDGDKTAIQKLHDFFNQPYPMLTFQSIRTDVRRDIESTGNGFIEVIRNAQDAIVFIRNVSALTVRLIRYDDPVQVTKKLTRGGAEVSVNVMVRERRYCQLISGKTLLYFKEYGSSRDLDKFTGHWAEPGQRLPADRRATEFLHFTCLPDARGPYGLPRWISQVPSVIGSRQAEEFNVDFFRNGGVPPALVIIQGGAMAPKTKEAVEQNVLFGSAASKNRIKVMEIEPVGGSIDSAGNARVTVERFGAERQQDSMFEKYDDKCEVRIRRSFRLPPIFVGHANDYNLATAQASYEVAEAQVFQPERKEFDDLISMTLVKDLGFPDYEIRSKPMVIKDVIAKLEGLKIAKETEVVSHDGLIDAVNEACGLQLAVDPARVADMEEKAANEREMQLIAMNPPQPSNQNTPPKQTPRQTELMKIDPAAKMLAVDTLSSVREQNWPEVRRNIQIAKSLTPKQAVEFKRACAALQFVDTSVDVDGLAQLAGCTLAVIDEQAKDHPYVEA